MARTSRKNSVPQCKQEHYPYQAAAYMRLSVLKGSEPSNSIKNQLRIIENYVLYRDDIELLEYYTDANTSGTSFDRPAFQKMLQDIIARKINCVIVKDLSRFGRNHTEVGYYLERYFPIKGVRFISINEHWDSIDGISNLHSDRSNISIPCSNLVNEAYAEDIRQKTQSVIDLQMSQGKFVAPRAPYGYRKDPNNCHQLIIDEDAAQNVKMIFDLASANISMNAIVRTLNDKKILTPIRYAIGHGLEGNYDTGNGLWNTRSVKKILTNPTYIGALIQGKEKKLVKDTHQPIISAALFQSIQERLSETSAYPTKEVTSTNILKGKVICGNCGGKLQRKKGSSHAEWYFFTCITKNRMGAEHCSGMYIRENEVIAAIQAEVVRQSETHRKLLSAYKDKILALKQQLQELIQKKEQQATGHRNWYEQMIMRQLTKNEYQAYSSQLPDIQKQIVQIQVAIKESRQNCKRSQLFCNVASGNEKIDILIELYLRKVTISSNKELQVTFC